MVNQYRNNATGPLWGSDGVPLGRYEVSPPGTGSCGWNSSTAQLGWKRPGRAIRCSIHFWNTLRVDDTVYASVGGNGSVLMGVDVSSGEVFGGVTRIREGQLHPGAVTDRDRWMQTVISPWRDCLGRESRSTPRFGSRKARPGQPRPSLARPFTSATRSPFAPSTWAQQSRRNSPSIRATKSERIACLNFVNIFS